jgi:hypothetical protein
VRPTHPRSGWRCKPRLSLEAGQGLGVFGDVIGQELQGDKPVQRYVFGLVDDTHTTAAELFDNAVVRDRRPCSALPENAALDRDTRDLRDCQPVKNGEVERRFASPLR